MFALFTRLTRDDGPPRTERLATGSGLQRLLGVPVRLVKASAAIPIVLVAGLMAAIIALGVVTSQSSACPSGSHQVRQARTAVCESSAHSMRK